MSDTTPDFVGDHDVDQTTLDIVESTLSNTRYEMDRVLETTAISPVIREQSDQFPLIADAKGRMVMGQFGSAIDTIIENSPFEVADLEDGDVLATNDPYVCAGAVSHTPDMLLLRPIFYEGDLVGYSSQWGNLMDVGGKTPGSMPVQAQTIFEEGMRLPPVKLYKGGDVDANCWSRSRTTPDCRSTPRPTSRRSRRGRRPPRRASTNSASASGRRPTSRPATRSSTGPATG